MIIAIYVRLIIVIIIIISRGGRFEKCFCLCVRARARELAWELESVGNLFFFLSLFCPSLPK